MTHSATPTLTIKNIPTKLHERLKKSTNEHHHNFNGEVIFLLGQGIRGRLVDPETYLIRVEELQKQVTPTPLTEEVLRTAKEEGRL